MTFLIGITTSPVFDIMTHLTARVSNRALLGLGLCRNEHFLHSVVRFAESLRIMALSSFLKWSPSFLVLLVRPWVSIFTYIVSSTLILRISLHMIIDFVLSSILGGTKSALNSNHTIRWSIHDRSSKQACSTLPLYMVIHADTRYFLEPRFGIYVRVLTRYGRIWFAGWHSWVQSYLIQFSKLRKKEGTDIKYGFATVDANFGRFLSLQGIMMYLEPLFI